MASILTEWLQTTVEDPWEPSPTPDYRASICSQEYCDRMRVAQAWDSGTLAGVPTRPVLSYAAPGNEPPNLPPSQRVAHPMSLP